MDKLDQIYELVPEIIEETREDGETLIFSSRAKEIIKEVAEYSRKTKIFAENKERAGEFWSAETENSAYKKTPRNVYFYMLDQIVNAPTLIHMYSSVILHMPALDKLVNGTEADQ